MQFLLLTKRKLDQTNPSTEATWKRRSLSIGMYAAATNACLVGYSTVARYDRLKTSETKAEI
jgi:hypothetical protein